MCGRFVAASTPDEIARYFDVTDVSEDAWEANYNVAPTEDVLVVREKDDQRRLDALRWGLVPAWAKDPSVGNRMINARSEGLAEKNAFKWAFRKRRCIVPADGFYEWKKVPGQKTKQPYFIARADGEPLALAGLWEVWRGPDRDGSTSLRTVTVLTTAANEMVAGLHDRMPVILPPGTWDAWLDRSEEDVAALGQLLVPAPESLLSMHPVSIEVNNARSEGAHLVDAIDLEADHLADAAAARPVSSAVGVQGTLL